MVPQAGGDRARASQERPVRPLGYTPVNGSVMCGSPVDGSASLRTLEARVARTGRLVRGAPRQEGVETRPTVLLQVASVNPVDGNADGPNLRGGPATALPNRSYFRSMASSTGPAPASPLKTGRPGG
jgi:hypothetical protein